MKGFLSDNTSGAHPEILQAIIQANQGHAPAYGYDPITDRAEQIFKDLFGLNTEVFFVFSGTGANVAALMALTRSYQSVLCTDIAHIHFDETGAAEAVAGCKLHPLPSVDGKLPIAALHDFLSYPWDEHAAKPRVVSITQPTEVGTLYTVEEISVISDEAHRHDLLLHMDGARISNAAVALDLPFREFTVEAGVDVLSFGGTKNGLLYGEAVVFFQSALAQDFRWIRKQSLQLSSKMRFISAQFEALLSHDLWRRNAQQANRMARRLGEGLSQVPGVRLTHPVQANGVWATLPPEIITPLRAQVPFSVWDPRTHEVRLMCSFDTTEEDVDQFIECLKALIE